MLTGEGIEAEERGAVVATTELLGNSGHIDCLTLINAKLHPVSSARWLKYAVAHHHIGYWSVRQYPTVENLFELIEEAIQIVGAAWQYCASLQSDIAAQSKKIVELTGVDQKQSTIKELRTAGLQFRGIETAWIRLQPTPTSACSFASQLESLSLLVVQTSWLGDSVVDSRCRERALGTVQDALKRTARGSQAFEPTISARPRTRWQTGLAGA